MTPRNRKTISKMRERGTSAIFLRILPLPWWNEYDVVIDGKEPSQDRLSHPERLRLGRVAGDDDELDRLDRKLRIVRITDRLDIVVGVQPDPVVNVLVTDRII